MSAIFIDTSYWLARSDARDALHKRAVELDYLFAKDSARFVTTDLVLIEWLNPVSGFGEASRREVVRQIFRMEDTDKIAIVHHSDLMFDFVIRNYRDYGDKAWSYTDCVSFYVMRSWKSAESLTFDHHFEQAGFRALLRP